jgi:hypothetical protein
MYKQILSKIFLHFFLDSYLILRHFKNFIYCNKGLCDACHLALEMKLFYIGIVMHISYIYDIILILFQ